MNKTLITLRFLFFTSLLGVVVTTKAWSFSVNLDSEDYAYLYRATLATYETQPWVCDDACAALSIAEANAVFDESYGYGNIVMSIVGSSATIDRDASGTCPIYHYRFRAGMGKSYAVMSVTAGWEGCPALYGLVKASLWFRVTEGGGTVGSKSRHLSVFGRVRPDGQSSVDVVMAPPYPGCKGTGKYANDFVIESVETGTVGIDGVYPPWFFGGDCGGCGFPINVADGRMYQTESDIVIPTPGIPLEYTRKYSSMMPTNSPSAVGEKWLNNYMRSVSLYTNSYTNVDTGAAYTNVWLLFQDMDIPRWHPLEYDVGSPTYRIASDVNWYPEYHADHSAEIIMQDGTQYSFDTNGVLTLISDNNGNFILLEYTNSYPSQKIIRALHSNGQSLQFSYSNNLIASVETPTTNLIVNYHCNEFGDLTNRTRIADGQAYIRNYWYDTNTWTHCLTQRVTEAGNAWGYDYERDTNGVFTSRGIREYLVQSNRYDMTVDYTDSDIGISYVSYMNNGRTNRYQYEYNPLTKRIDNIYGPITTNLTEWVGVRYDKDAFENREKAHFGDFRFDVMEYAELWTPFDENGRFMTNFGYGYMCEPTNFWQYAWNTNNMQIAEVQDPLGNRVSYEYTNNLLLAENHYVTESNVLTTAYGYTTNGLLAVVTNANGHATSYTYDDLGFMSGIIPEQGMAISISNNVLGHAVRMTFTGERSVEFDRDPLGRIHRIDYPDSTYETMTYDNGGQLLSVTDRAGFTTTNAWYPGGKLASVTRCGATTNLTIRYDYDQQGNALTVVDEMGRSVEHYLLDDADRPSQVSNVDSQTMFITYGLGKYIKSIQRFDGSMITNKYNGDGLLVEQLFADPMNNGTLKAQSVYYNNGLLMKKELLSLFSGNYVTNAAVSNVFDGVGRLVGETVSHPGLTYNLQRQYDGVGHVTNLTETQLGDIQRYYSFDAAERLADISSEAGFFELSYSTNNGMMEFLSLPNGLTEKYQYDLMDRVTQIEYTDTNEVSQQTIQYAYNTRGMITQKVITASAESTTYGYTFDDFNRLIRETTATNSTLISDVQWQYDGAGNRLNKNNGSGDLTYYRVSPGNQLDAWNYQYTNTATIARLTGGSSEAIGTDDRWGQLWVSNQAAYTPWVDGTNFGVSNLVINPGENTIIAAIRDQAGNTTLATNVVSLTAGIFTNGAYQYDAAGCLTQMIYSSENGSRTVGLSWNLKYELTQISTTNGNSTYQYGADGRMISRTTDGETSYLIYDGLHLIAEVDTNYFATRRYTYGPGIDNILAMTTATEGQTNTYYYLKDHQNSVLALTDENGNIVESYSYNAWGRTTVYDANGNELTESSYGNRICWQGREIDWSTGIYYFRARWYDPITGRFLSKDPIGISGGLNQYVFCGNNPVNYVDPMGLDECNNTNSVDNFPWGEDYEPGPPQVFDSLDDFLRAIGDHFVVGPFKDNLSEWMSNHPWSKPAAIPIAVVGGGTYMLYTGQGYDLDESLDIWQYSENGVLFFNIKGTVPWDCIIDPDFDFGEFSAGVNVRF